MTTLYECDFLSLTWEEEGFFIEYDNEDQEVEKIFLGKTPGEAISELQSIGEGDLTKYITQEIDSMTFKDFIENCCVPDDYEWSGTANGIIKIKDNYGIAEINVSDDPNFDVKATTDEGYIINWGGEDVLITDDIYQESYIIVEILNNTPEKPFHAIPASPDFYYYIEDAEKVLNEYINEQ